MATIPTAPNFTGVTVPSIAQLNQLSQCASFLSNRNVSPLWHAFRNSDSLSGSSGFNTVSWTGIAYDSDGVFTSSSSAVIVTQGVYATECCISFAESANGPAWNYASCFVITGGNNNPKLGNGSTVYYGMRASLAGADAEAVNYTNTPTELTPMIVYPGDTISVVVGASLGGGVAVSALAISADQFLHRFVYNFTGHWVGPGSATSNTGH